MGKIVRRRHYKRHYKKTGDPIPAGTPVKVKRYKKTLTRVTRTAI